MWLTEPTFCSFIIPTLGRKSLSNTVNSLLELDDWNWRAYIIFDGKEPIKLESGFDYLSDNHFIVLKSDERLYNAGLVRNLALPLIDTEWTAFLDDDDTLKSTYLERLKYHSNLNPDKDIIIFTYKDLSNGNIQPNPNVKDIERCKVGISFAIKTKFVEKHNLRFQAGGIEDFAFLDQARSLGAKYLLTHDIQYLVSKRGVWK